ncbi:MAG TPA: hypothetical protein VHB27_24215 [Rhodopila sp.]|uniref:hypothetical protein n=1 Tax=Rhodopila sp. TaxID=2480087 RepID=UPI002C230E2D|nr:hypothetical protein [Rhodopila sp.]HVY18347.1 hypothetical protein [Rhodopila sp.]
MSAAQGIAQGTAQRVCGICGHAARPPFRAPQPEIAPDLDMRPGEPTRSTLRDWVQACPGCGAVAEDLAALPASARSVVESEAYRLLSTKGIEETLPFRRAAMIAAAAGNVAGQAEALLQAAWAADDAAAMAEAAALRTEVAALWGDEATGELALRRLDALRRSGQFKAAAAWAEATTSRVTEELGRSIVAFQTQRIAARDVGRHLISSVLPPPAHKPHVSHGKRVTTGFWSRVLGRRG